MRIRELSGHRKRLDGEGGALICETLRDGARDGDFFTSLRVSANLPNALDRSTRIL